MLCMLNVLILCSDKLCDGFSGGRAIPFATGTACIDVLLVPWPYDTIPVWCRGRDVKKNCSSS